MCRFHQTSPESMFTRLRLCTLATPTGRITLTARANGSAFPPFPRFPQIRDP